MEKISAELTKVDENYPLLYEQASAYSSQLEMKENESRNWKVKTVGIQEVLDDRRKPISNNVLLWLSAQLDTTPEASIFDSAIKHFLEEEMNNAKTVLFDVCGGEDTTIGAKELRRGGAKESRKDKDCKDIIEAIKTLREEGSEPLFVASKDGIMKCPTIIPVSNIMKDNAVMLKINALEAAMKNSLIEQKKQNDHVNSRLESTLKDNVIKNFALQMKDFDSSLEAF